MNNVVPIKAYSTGLPGARKATRKPSNKPHIFKPHHDWKCFTHNASGSGTTPEEAYKSWLWADHRYQMRAAIRRSRGLKT